MFIIPRSADLHGRRVPIILCQFLQLPTLLYFYVMQSWVGLTVCMFLLGFALGGSYTACSIYTQEFLQKRHRSTVIAMSATIEGLALLAVGLYFLYLTRDWRIWFYGVILIQVFVIFGLFWLPESPDFLFAKGRFAESRDVILRIAQFNGRTSVTSESICFGGHRPEVYYRGTTRDEILNASL